MAAVVIVAALSWPRGTKEKHFLEYSQDKFKSVFTSGNLTAAVTHDWPRIIFEHTTDPFSSTFEVGFPRLYLYNDSNSDGYFSLSELTHVSYLDENHVVWNITPVVFGHDAYRSEYAVFSMSAVLNLYDGINNATPSVDDWASVTFWFTISQKDISYSNSLGSYTVKSRTDASLNMTLDVKKATDGTGVVVEHSLVGGGSTYFFVVREQGAHHSIVDETVSARVDESVYGTNFTHGFSDTSLPVQQISFADEQHVIQAYYVWDSEPTLDVDGGETVLAMSNSYFTTSTGMTLHSAYLISNQTGAIHQMAIIGIDEAGFTGAIHNWLRENLVMVVVFTGVMAVLIILSAFLLVRMRKRATKDLGDRKEETEEKP